MNANGQLETVNSLWELPGPLKPHDFSVLNIRWAVKAIIESIHPEVLVNAAVILIYAVDSFFTTLITVLK